MLGVSEQTIVVNGEGRLLPAGTANTPVTFELRATDFTLSGAGRALTASYRDLATVAVDQSRLLIDVGGSRILAEKLGDRLGMLVTELRARRARQMLSDRFIEVPDRDAIELVEYESAGEHGVAQMAFHPWGLAFMPLDERHGWRLLRRADIASVTADQSRGRVDVTVSARPNGPPTAPIALVGLGAAAVRQRARIDGLRAEALADAATIVGGLIPDAPSSDREAASQRLVDGRPNSPNDVGAAWVALEQAVLADPTYAASYKAMVERGGGSATAKRWISLAPKSPGKPEEHMAWFFVALPNDLLGFELVSEGSHATYIFRSSGSPEAAVFDVSESLIDARFLREPIYMTDQDLDAPDSMRYRYAIAALPSLRAARGRFVRRLIHTDDASWAASLDETISKGA